MAKPSAKPLTRPQAAKEIVRRAEDHGLNAPKGSTIRIFAPMDTYRVPKTWSPRHLLLRREVKRKAEERQLVLTKASGPEFIFIALI